MPRPECNRIVSELPATSVFKPQGIAHQLLERVELTVDEFEAIRLADLHGLYQEQGAEQMQVSRQTFGRILTSAHRKVADFLVNGKALRIQGGHVELRQAHGFKCYSCRHEWREDPPKERGECCPKCSSRKLAPNRDPDQHTTTEDKNK